MKHALCVSVALATLAMQVPALASPDRRGLRVGIEFSDGNGHIRGNVGFPRIRHGCRPARTIRVWVAGHYDWQERVIVVPGRWVTVRQPGYAGIRCGARRVWQPATRRVVRDRVWVPGHSVVRHHR